MTTEQSVRPPRRASEFLAGFHRADNPDWRISMQTVVRKLEDEIDRLRAELKSETNWLNATKAPKSEPTESGEQPTASDTTPPCEPTGNASETQWAPEQIAAWAAEGRPALALRRLPPLVGREAPDDVTPAMIEAGKAIFFENVEMAGATGDYGAALVAIYRAMRAAC